MILIRFVRSSLWNDDKFILRWPGNRISPPCGVVRMDVILDVSMFLEETVLMFRRVQRKNGLFINIYYTVLYSCYSISWLHRTTSLPCVLHQHKCQQTASKTVDETFAVAYGQSRKIMLPASDWRPKLVLPLSSSSLQVTPTFTSTNVM